MNPGEPIGGVVHPVQTIAFSITGKPKAWARMREHGFYNPKTKRVFVRKFKQDDVLTNEALMRMAFEDRMREEEGFQPWEGPVGLSVVCYFPIPGKPKWWQEAALAKLIPHDKKPDQDNLLKLVGDSLNNVAWKDDKTIVVGHVEKWYSDNPRTEITIYLYPEIKREFYDMAPKEESTDELQKNLFET